MNCIARCVGFGLEDAARKEIIKLSRISPIPIQPWVQIAISGYEKIYIINNYSTIQG